MTGVVYPSEFVVGPTAEAIVGALRHGAVCRCGGRHRSTGWLDANALAQLTGYPKRSIRHHAARLVKAGVLEGTTEAWRLTDDVAWRSPAGSDQDEAAGPDQGDPGMS